MVANHVHTVVGGTNFKRKETNQDAINSNSTTCDKMLDKSNYWIPQLYAVQTGRTRLTELSKLISAYFRIDQWLALLHDV